MRLTLLKSKLHRARVTASDLNYEGSIALAPELRRAAGLLLHERVEIYNVTNGQRFATYVIGGRRRGEVMVNGAAARLVQPGDEVIIAAYAEFESTEAKAHVPVVVLLDANNRPRLKRPPMPGSQRLTARGRSKSPRRNRQ
jgi:aspartate 1-decarboxylase